MITNHRVRFKLVGFLKRIALGMQIPAREENRRFAGFFFLEEREMDNKEVEKVQLSRAEQRVFDYMADFGSITTLQSCVDLGETRLSSIIFNLRKKGVAIGGETEEVTNRYGERRRVKKYTIG